MATGTVSTGSTALMDGFRRCVDNCNDAAGMRSSFVPFTIEGRAFGYLNKSSAETLCQFADVFVATDAEVSLAGSLRTAEQRTQAVGTVLAKLRDDGLVTGWRNELYPVVDRFSSQPAMLMERAASAIFGIKAYGVHINGYVERADGSREMWVARRSKTKQTFPGMLDHIVAGGQPHGISPGENVVKECFEEAGIPTKLAAAARPAGAVSYECLNSKGFLKREVMFVYDLCLPEDFVPQPQDGEVEEFYLWPMEKVMQVVAEGKEYKYNCQLVVIDFLLRHGYITPEQDGYLELLAGMRQGDCS